MKTARLLPALLILIAGTASAAPAVDPDARARMVDILAQFNAISDIDIGNCDHEHAEFSKAYRALTESPASVAMGRVMEHFQLQEQAPAKVDHNPTAERCLAALEKAKALFATHGEYIQKIAATLPPAPAE